MTDSVTDQQATPVELTAAAIEDLRTRIQPFKEDSGSLLEALYAAQDGLGYVPREAIELISEELGYPEAHVYGVVTFYTMFYTEPQAIHILRICRDLPCYLNGAGGVVAAAEKKLGIHSGQCTDDGEFKIEQVSCLGQCDGQPVLLDNLAVHGSMTPARVEELIDSLRGEAS